jgi:hypothetical protein
MRLDLSAADELGERLAAIRGCADARPEKSDRSASSERGKRPVGNVIDDDDTHLGDRRQPSAGGAGRNESDGHCREDSKQRQETSGTDHVVILTYPLNEPPGQPPDHVA